MNLTHGGNDSLSLYLPNEAATRALGGRLAAGLGPGMVVYLLGDLGAGKTTLVRGLLEALGHLGAVKSPSYSLVEPYVVSNLNLYHFDFYRFTDAAEFEEAGLAEYFGAEALCLVEWPSHAQAYVPPADLSLSLTPQGDGRLAHLQAHTQRGQQCLSQLQ